MYTLSNNTDSFLRIASISVAAYDYTITLPAEWRLYSSKGPLPFTINLNNVLFILIRYTSMITIIISNIGYFYQGFSSAACQKYYLVSPVWKVTQTMISQVILGWRAYNISRRSQSTGIFLIAFGVFITGLQWFTNLYARIPSQNLGNCTSGNSPEILVAWIYYALATLFDAVTLGLSTFYLLKSAPDKTKMTDLIKMLLYDGMGYFIVLTGANVVNIILYRGSDRGLQSSGASLGYTVIWIMSQNLLLHIREAAAKRVHCAELVTHQLSTARDAADMMRLPFVAGGRDSPKSMDLSVQVQIEHAVTVEYDPIYKYRRESYRKPRVIWDSRPISR